MAHCQRPRGPASGVVYICTPSVRSAFAIIAAPGPLSQTRDSNHRTFHLVHVSLASSSRRTRHIARAFLLAACVAGAHALGAQNPIVVRSSGSAQVTAVPGTHLAIPVLVDMSSAGGANIAALNTSLTWGASEAHLRLRGGR